MLEAVEEYLESENANRETGQWPSQRETRRQLVGGGYLIQKEAPLIPPQREAEMRDALVYASKARCIHLRNLSKLRFLRNQAREAIKRQPTQQLHLLVGQDRDEQSNQRHV